MSWTQILIIGPFIIIMWAAAIMASMGLWYTAKELFSDNRKPK